MADTSAAMSSTNISGGGEQELRKEN